MEAAINQFSYTVHAKNIPQQFPVGLFSRQHHWKPPLTSLLKIVTTSHQADSADADVSPGHV